MNLQKIFAKPMESQSNVVLMFLSCKYICNNINAFLAERNICEKKHHCHFPLEIVTVVFLCYNTLSDRLINRRLPKSLTFKITE